MARLAFLHGGLFRTIMSFPEEKSKKLVDYFAKTNKYL